LLLVSDLDGTLIAPIPVAEEVLDALGRFRRLIGSRSDLMLAYATGRDYDLALEGIRAFDLPMPDAILTDVGTRFLHRFPGTERYEEDQAYADRLRTVFDTGERAHVESLLGSISGVELQEATRQGTFKVSFDVDPGIDDEAVLAQVASALSQRRDRLKVVFSRDPADSRGLLDVLPREVSKASAARHLSESLGLPDRCVLYFGDSGNDTDALLAGFSGVLVGNAPESLRAFLRESAVSRGIADRLYFAESSYAAGVVEGCRYFQVL
jgi:sucrose-6F-phosphate phosphohydrolase